MTTASADRDVELHVRLGGPDGTASQWDETRTIRHSRLTQRAPQLGSLYGTAVNLLEVTSEPGVITLVAHCVREIYNRFLDWDGVKMIGAQNEFDNASKALADIWPEVDPTASATCRWVTGAISRAPCWCSAARSSRWRATRWRIGENAVPRSSPTRQ